MLFLIFVAISVMAFPASAEEDDTVYYINYCGKWITNKNLSVKTLYTNLDAATFDPDTNTLTIKHSMLSDEYAISTEDCGEYINANGETEYAMIYVDDTLKNQRLTIKADSNDGKTIKLKYYKSYDDYKNNDSNFGGIYAPYSNVVIEGNNNIEIFTDRTAITCQNLTVNSYFGPESKLGASIKVSKTLTVNSELVVRSNDAGAYTDGVAISASNFVVNESGEVDLFLRCQSIEKKDNPNKKQFLTAYAVKADNVKVDGGSLAIINFFDANGFCEYNETYGWQNDIYGLKCDSLTLSNGTVNCENRYANDFKDYKNINRVSADINTVVFCGSGYLYTTYSTFINKIEVKGPYIFKIETDNTVYEHDAYVERFAVPIENADTVYIRSRGSDVAQYSFLANFGDDVKDINYTTDFSVDEFTSIVREFADKYKVVLSDNGSSGDAFTYIFDEWDLTRSLPEITVICGQTLILKTDSSHFQDPDYTQNNSRHIATEISLENKIILDLDASLYVKTDVTVLKGLNVESLDEDGGGTLYCESGTTCGTVDDTVELVVTGGSHNLEYGGTAYGGLSVSGNSRWTVEKTPYICLSETDFDWKKCKMYVSSVCNSTSKYYAYEGYNGNYFYPDENNALYLWLPKTYKDLTVNIWKNSSGHYDKNHKLYSFEPAKPFSDGTIYLLDEEFIVDDLQLGTENYIIGSDLVVVSEFIYEDVNSFPSENIKYAWYLTDKNNNRTKIAETSKLTFHNDSIAPGDYTLVREVIYNDKFIIRRDWCYICAALFTQPKNAHAIPGTDCEFFADCEYVSDGYSFSKIKWQADKGDGNGFCDIENSNSKTYTVTGITEDNIDALCAYKYRAVVVFADSNQNERAFYSDEARLYQLSMDKSTIKLYVGEGEEYVMTAFEESELREGYTVEWSYTDSRDNTVHKIDCNSLSYSKTVSAEDDYFDYACVVSYDGVPSGKHVFDIDVVAFVQPQNQIAALNETVTFSSGILQQRTTWSVQNFSWEVDKGDGNGFKKIDGATAKTYTFVVNDENIYNYKYRLRFDSGVLTTSGFEYFTYYSNEVKAIGVPQIIQQPENMTVHIADETEHSFSVKALGATFYQWQIKNGDDWNDLDGKTSDTLTFAKMSDELDGTQYRCKISNNVGSSYSESATLTVKHTPKIEAAPKDVVALAGDFAKFAVDGFSIVENDADIYWQYSADGGKTWVDIKVIHNSNFNMYYELVSTYQIVFGEKDLETGGWISSPTTIKTYIGSVLNIQKVTAEMDGWLVRCVTQDDYAAVGTDSAKITVLNCGAEIADYAYGSTPSQPNATGVPSGSTVTFYYNTENSNQNGTKWENITSTSLAEGTYYIYAVVSNIPNCEGTVVTAPKAFSVKPQEAAQKTLSATVLWDSFEFTYSNGEYNPQTHAISEGKWETNGGLITLKNMSEEKITVTFTFIPDSDITGITGSFSKSCLTVAAGSSEYVEFSLLGKPSKEVKNAMPGTVTVNITQTADGKTDNVETDLVDNVYID